MLRTVLITGLLLLPTATGCTTVLTSIDPVSLLFDLFLPQSEAERDKEFRGPGSSEAWRDATGGRYDGSLPDC